MTGVSASRSRVIGGGASLVAATMLFAAVFSYLAILWLIYGVMTGLLRWP